MLTSWITSSLLIVPKHRHVFYWPLIPRSTLKLCLLVFHYCSSAACGPSSNGRTVSMCLRQCRMYISLTVYDDSCLHLVTSEPREYLKHIMKSTNMSCLTPEGAMAGDSDFLSANMYARS